MGGKLSKAKLLSKTLRILHLSSSELCQTLESVATKKDSRMTTTGEMQDRYLFDDSSAIIVSENGWGVQAKAPWSWKAVTFQDNR